MTLAYNLAFTCLLRFDEVLRIQSQDIILLPNNCLKVTLPFRKTSQYGGMHTLATCLIFFIAYVHLEIKPFVLHMMPSAMAYLCPVCAFAEWKTVLRIREGYIFHKMASGDRISVNNDPMV